MIEEKNENIYCEITSFSFALLHFEEAKNFSFIWSNTKKNLVLFINRHPNPTSPEKEELIVSYINKKTNIGLLCSNDINKKNAPLKVSRYFFDLLKIKKIQYKGINDSGIYELIVPIKNFKTDLQKLCKLLNTKKRILLIETIK